MNNDNEPIKITVEDLAALDPGASLPVSGEPANTGDGTRRSYGSISNSGSEGDEAPELTSERGSIFLQGWFYLGASGLLGALLAWAVCEPGFVEGGGSRWGNVWMLPGIVTAMCVGFGLAESIVERSFRKAMIRGALSLPLGIVLGFVFYLVANLLFNAGLHMIADVGIESFHNPVFWMVRGIAWAVFGAAGGAVYGIVGQSAKKAEYGIYGGMAGAALGGLIFDPVALLTGGAGASRALGFGLVGAATGLAMGWVENLLKDRWLYVTSGPLAGKQFILYKANTTIGNIQTADIYLFKDPNILPQHAMISVNGSRVQIRAAGSVFIGANPVKIRVLQDGDVLQIGRYSFRYKEKGRK